MFQINADKIPLIEIFDEIIAQKNSRLFVLREDLIHPEISGNKWRKLKYNILEAKDKGHETLLTYGGAYSNHIAATAAAGKYFGIKTVGIIRGEETLPLNSTLQLAIQNGMKLYYVSREAYRNKDRSEFIKNLKTELGSFYQVPEGGTNAFALKGCTEIIQNIKEDFDIICCACGTGGTIAGVIASLNDQKEVFGFPVLKNESFLKENIQQLLTDYTATFNERVINNTWQLKTDYHFGGYAKVKPELISFVQEFKKKHEIPLDLVYTGKMMFGIYDLLQHTNELDNKTVIAIHTGGLQGNKGFEERFNIRL